MQTELHPSIADTHSGRRAQEILRSCVHCGFCNATCPTYLATGDELDGPRGRIYLMKEMLEAGEANAVAQNHLDRCLTCRACETTCPSGVAYGELLEVGRSLAESAGSRGFVTDVIRRWLKAVVPDVRAFRRWATLGGWVRWLLPVRLRRQLPEVAELRPIVGSTHERKVLVLEGCVQQVATPTVNAALAERLGERGFQVLTAAGEACCGSLNLHLGDEAGARAQMRHNVDVLWPLLGELDAVLSTASGCGVTYKDYGRLLADDADYADKAAALSAKVLDVAEFCEREELQFDRAADVQRVAWQAPCTLQHGQQVNGTVERLLERAGYALVDVADGHLCCGSAGTYSVLQPDLSERLRDAKLNALCANTPDVIATANVGCQTHLASASGIPVRHWVELLR